MLNLISRPAEAEALSRYNVKRLLTCRLRQGSNNMYNLSALLLLNIFVFHQNAKKNIVKSHPIVKYEIKHQNSFIKEA